MISKGFLVLVPHSACKHSHEIPPWFSDCGMVKSNLGMVIKWELEKKNHTHAVPKKARRGPLVTGSLEPPCGQ